MLKKVMLSNVVIRYTIGADYQVGTIEQDYIKTRPDVSALKRPFLPSSEEGQVYLRAGIENHLKPHMERHLRPALTGANPVTAEIRVLKIWIPGKIRGALVNEGYYMDAVFALVDDVSGISVYESKTIHAAYDAAIQIGGASVPDTGNSKKLNAIGNTFAEMAVQGLRNDIANQPFDSDSF